MLSYMLFRLSSPEPTAHRMGVELACVHTFKLEYLCNHQANCIQILSEAHWGGGKAALGFGPDQIRTLVSMTTDSSHRVIMGKTVSPLFLGCF